MSPHYAVVARFYLEVQGDPDEAKRKIQAALEGLGARHLRPNDMALDVLRVSARTPYAPSETTAERRARYERRKAEREAAHRKNQETS